MKWTAVWRCGFGAVVLAAPGLAFGVQCGDTLTADTVLDADVVCPSTFTGTALIIGADGITLDGNGFWLDAPSAEEGLAVGAHSGVTVKNLTVAARNWAITSCDKPQCARGAGYGPAGIGNTYSNLAIQNGGTGRGLSLVHSDGNTVSGVTTTDVLEPVYLLGSDDNQIAGVVPSWSAETLAAKPTGAVGVQFIGSQRNALTGSAIHGAYVAVSIQGDPANASWEARAADGNEVVGNDLSGNANGIVFGTHGSGTRIASNDLSASGNYAVKIDGDSGASLQGNTFTGSANGISLANLRGATLAGPDLSSITGIGLFLNGVSSSSFSDLQVGGAFGIKLKGSSGNTFHGAQVAPAIGITGTYGIWAYSDSTGNLFEETSVSLYPTGVYLQSPENSFQCGYLIGNVSVGLHSDKVKGTLANLNVIEGNVGVYNTVDTAAPASTDATLNWWGAADGPRTSGPYDGLHSYVSSDVSYDPWISDPAHLDAPCGRNLDPAAACSGLVEQIHAFGFRKGTDKSLTTIAEAVCRKIDAGLTGAAIEQLDAFVHHVDSQTDTLDHEKTIADQSAADLIQTALDLQALLE